MTEAAHGSAQGTLCRKVHRRRVFSCSCAGVRPSKRRPPKASRHARPGGPGPSGSAPLDRPTQPLAHLHRLVRDRAQDRPQIGPHLRATGRSASSPRPARRPTSRTGPTGRAATATAPRPPADRPAHARPAPAARSRPGQRPSAGPGSGHERSGQPLPRNRTGSCLHPLARIIGVLRLPAFHELGQRAHRSSAGMTIFSSTF